MLDEEVQREPGADEDDVGGKQNAGEGSDARRRQGVAVGLRPMIVCVAGAGGGGDGAKGVVVAERRAIDAVVVAVLVFDEELLCAVAVGFQRADIRACSTSRRGRNERGIGRAAALQNLAR